MNSVHHKTQKSSLFVSANTLDQNVENTLDQARRLDERKLALAGEQGGDAVNASPDCLRRLFDSAAIDVAAFDALAHSLAQAIEAGHTSLGSGALGDLGLPFGNHEGHYVFIGI